MDVLEDLRVAGGEWERLLANVRDDQWSLPTPCTEWDVRTLVAHVIGGTCFFHSILTDTAPPGAADTPADDAIAAWRAAIEPLDAAFAAPGALERSYRTPLGTVPGAVVASLRVTEMLVHGWDLARATGQPTDLAPELSEAALARVRLMLDNPNRPAGLFGPPRTPPPGASAADRLAATLGREV